MIEIWEECYRFQTISQRLAVKNGKTILIQIKSQQITAPNNYRPIMCLQMMSKILIVQIREEIYISLISPGLFPEEQKGCHKWTRGTGELLYINQHIFKESKTRWENLAMV